MEQNFGFSGQLVAPTGLGRLRSCLSRCSWQIDVTQSGYDGTLYLRSAFEEKEIYLDMDSGQSGTFLFGGDVTGSLDRATLLLQDFSRCLSEDGIVHRMELYGDDEGGSEKLVAYFHHQWPEGT